MTKFTNFIQILIIAFILTPIVAVAADVGGNNNDQNPVAATKENVSAINRAIDEARAKIGVFLKMDARAPKLSDSYIVFNSRDNVFKSQDWIVEINKKEIIAKAYFNEADGSVSEHEKGDIEITLKFEYELNGKTINKLKFYNFTFEKNIVWVELKI